MELLIPGLLLVALMVWASTRFKRLAKEAFEPETIDNDLFSLEKPEGMLHVLNGREDLLFESYSKAFGDGPASNIRAVRADITERTGFDRSAFIKDLKASGTVEEQHSEMIDGRRYDMLTINESGNALKYAVTYRIAEKAGKLYVLQIKMLADAGDETAEKVDAMAESFTLK